MKPRKTNKIIMKFGGTSVGSPGVIQQLISIVTSSKEPVAGVVVSAFAGVTNQLITAAEHASNGDKTYNRIFLEIADRHIGVVHELITDPKIKKETLKEVEATLEELESVLHGVFLIRELSPKILDTVMSYGELLSAYIVSRSFVVRGVASEFVDTRELVKTDATFGSAHPYLEPTYEKIATYFRESKKAVKIITGFLGSTGKGETTTLGRGGSDYTASLFGAAINVAKIEIWTDMDGIQTADSEKVPSAFTIKKMTYQEAMEMLYFGTRVIYPQTLVPAYSNNIPLVIRNTFHPEFAGTIIGAETSNAHMIKRISSIENIALVQIQGSGLRGTTGIAARLFGALAFYNINIILITQASSEYTICFAIDPEDTPKAKLAIDDEFKYEIRDGLIDTPVFEENLSIIAVIGEQMKKRLGVAGKVFTTLGDAKINVSAIAQGSSERNISFVVAKKDNVEAIQALHKTFFGK